MKTTRPKFLAAFTMLVLIAPATASLAASDAGSGYDDSYPCGAATYAFQMAWDDRALGIPLQFELHRSLDAWEFGAHASEQLAARQAIKEVYLDDGKTPYGALRERILSSACP